MTGVPRMHLIAPAGSCQPFIQALNLRDSRELVALVQDSVGDRFRVTGDPRLLEAVEVDDRGGRTDDRERVFDLQSALGDDDVVAILALRGGAWLTRLVPHLDFSVLGRRRSKVALMGFSEITTLVNIVGGSPNGIGIYDMSPAFLTYGLKRFAMLQARRANAGSAGNPSERPAELPIVDCRLSIEQGNIRAGSASRRRAVAGDRFRAAPPRAKVDDSMAGPSGPPLPLLYEGLAPEAWMKRRLLPEFRAFLDDVANMLCGAGTRRTIRASLVRGRLPDDCNATFIGGNLCVFTTLLGTPYQSSIEPSGRWVALEEINEKPERIDRFLARLTLAGYWDRCAGILLGDLHNADRDHTEATIALLDYHLPRSRPDLPVLATLDVGHVWPMSPLPVHTAMKIRRIGLDDFEITWQPEAVMTTGAC